MKSRRLNWKNPSLHPASVPRRVKEIVDNLRYDNTACLSICPAAVDSVQLKLCGEPRYEIRGCGNANDGWKMLCAKVPRRLPLEQRWSPGLISSSPASAMGIAESVFGLLWGSSPTFLANRSSAIYPRPISISRLRKYLCTSLPTLVFSVQRVTVIHGCLGVYRY